MSFDLADSESRFSSLRPVTRPESGVWDNFLSGTGRITMQGFAKTARAGSMAAAAIVTPALERMGGTELSDRYFKLHDDVFGNAVDYWTPKPGEVGAAAEVVGSLLSTLPTVIAAPGATVASMQLSTAEDLVRKGVDATAAQKVGAVQAAGLGLGVWMPILGNNLWQRALVGGAGFNVAQGMVTRGVSGSILEGTPAAKDFEAFDWQSVTLDALLGVAFGGLTHLSPAQRAQGEAAWQRVEGWIKGAKPSDIDALMVLKQAEHLNVDSAPGKPRDLPDIDAHTQRMRAALEQDAQGKPIDVEGLPAPKFDPDPERRTAEVRTLEVMQREAAKIARDYGIRVDEPAPDAKPAAEMPAPEQPPVPEQPGAGQPVAEGAKPVDPVTAEAQRFAAQNPEFTIITGQNADGTPITVKAADYLAQADADAKQAQADAKLFEVAAACMLGVS